VVNGTLWVSMVFRAPMSSGSSPTPTSHGSGYSSGTHTWVPGHPARAKATATATAKATAHALTARVLPAGVVCSATATAAARVRDLTGLTAADHTVRLVEQGQLMLRGYQCGRALPMTGVFDAATLKALAQG
jgi:hypothetical protein